MQVVIEVFLQWCLQATSEFMTLAFKQSKQTIQSLGTAREFGVAACESFDLRGEFRALLFGPLRTGRFKLGLQANDLLGSHAELFFNLHSTATQALNILRENVGASFGDLLSLGVDTLC